MAALRAEAADVDTQIKSMGRRKADGDGVAQQRLASIAATGARSG